MTGILFLALVVLGVVAAAQGQKLHQLTRRLDRLERTRPAPVEFVAPEPEPRVEPEPEPLETTQIWTATPAPPPEPQPERVTRPGLETLIGARLPIWIGAIALVAAGFFLVRYSIETGLLGPAVRTTLAALFAIALVAASEVARRLPATQDDPRIAQALAGAGIASAYGTLYMAAALYHLIAPLPAFVLMLGVTAIGLFLALRHGPPTAILALVGGFVAPLVAGYDAAGIAPLLVYLALLTGALFGLAIQRGWAWLAIAATVAGFGWINFLLFVLAGDNLAAPAGFAVLLAIAASLALPRAGVESAWLRLAPLVAGLVQLLAFAPALDFSPLGWGLYLILAAAALILAWRDDRYLPGALAALGLTLVLIAIGLTMPEPGITLTATIFVAILFAAPGLWFLHKARIWAILALGGITGPILLANPLESDRLADWQWAALELLAAALAAWISFRRRAAIDSRDPGLVGGALAGAILAATALGQLAGFDWLALPLAAIALALGWWARDTKDAMLFQLPTLAIAAILLAGTVPLAAYGALIAESGSGAHLTYNLLPNLGEAFRHLLPALIATAILLIDRRQFGRARPLAMVAGIALGLLLLYHLGKLPLAIADEPRFIAWGFVERMLMTQALFATGWLLLRRPGFGTAGIYLFALGLVRFAWFDLMVFNPALVTQSVGGIPLLNAAVLHAAFAAAWCWTFAIDRPWRNLGMAFTFVAVAAGVRQAAHGTLLTGPVGTGENYGYSAAFLLLALAWLALGIRSGARDLRFAGLGLLTIVTIKVFLIDASALDGLLRVVSFLGLGIALIALGWVYTRFLGASAAAPARSPTRPPI